MVVEDLADARLFLFGELAVVGAKIGADRKTALDAGPCANLLEPSLEMLELVDVLTLCLPVDGRG